MAALVVGAAFADRLAAGAEGGDGNGHGHLEAEIFAVESGIEAGLVIHQAGGIGDRGFLFDEVGEIKFEVGGVGLKAFLQGPENGRDAFHVDQTAVFLQNLDEAAHVGALELMGEIDSEGDGGDGVLRRVGPVTNNDGIAEAFDADLVDSQVAKVGRGLGVVQGVRLGGGLFQRIFILTDFRLRAKDTGGWGHHLARERKKVRLDG